MTVQWGDVPTWVAFGAAAAAAAIAAGAWRSQVNEGRDNAKRARREAAISHVAEATRDLTTDPVVKARDRVASWSRASPDEAYAAVRHDVFVLLWALHRLGPLALDLDLTEDHHRKVIKVHVELIVKNLTSFAEVLHRRNGMAALEEFELSAGAARDSVGALLSSLGADPNIRDQVDGLLREPRR